MVRAKWRIGAQTRVVAESHNVHRTQLPEPTADRHNSEVAVEGHNGHASPQLQVLCRPQHPLEEACPLCERSALGRLALLGCMLVGCSQSLVLGWLMAVLRHWRQLW